MAAAINFLFGINLVFDIKIAFFISFASFLSGLFGIGSMVEKS